jgi:CheY-like chemotaxis protein
MGSAPQPSDQVVLVVDDEEVVRHLMSRALTDAGFRVLEAHDGEEAATLLGTLGPTLV